MVNSSAGNRLGSPLIGSALIYFTRQIKKTALASTIATEKFSLAIFVKRCFANAERVTTSCPEIFKSLHGAKSNIPSSNYSETRATDITFFGARRQ